MVRYTFIFVLVVSVLLAVLVLLGGPLPVPLAAARLLLGLTVALFCPGCALQMALFPRRNGLDGVERLALSVGISLALVPLLALALDQLPGGINRKSVAGAEVGATLLALAVAWARWHRLPEGERWEERLPSLGDLPEGCSRFWLYGMGVVLVAGLLLLLGLIRLVGTGGETTEFYLLGPDGRSDSYPRRAYVGRPVTIAVGVVNGEEMAVEYRLEVVDGERLLG